MTFLSGLFLTAMTSMSLEIMILLLIIALVGGVCITTIGPGGIFVTIALFALLPLDPSTVAGTASATFIATGIVGSLGYLRSGELKGKVAGKAAGVLSLASVIGAFAGAQINTLLDKSLFAILLGAFVFFTGILILYRQKKQLKPDSKLQIDSSKGLLWLAGVGIAVGLPGGLLGVGGPVLAVPLMVVLGVPMLLSVALAQVQSIFISGFATVGYMIHDAVDWYLALFLTVPLLIGTVSGWYLAQRIKASKLQVSLALVLIALGIYLIAGGATPGGA
ncbi:sulfite exporter TauE/SafE family protein [Gracilimonas tropica]|uniref:sulfite exporter TauE/SafE family protein n=1 Tax=Gracilimonas tropica TaxID=454600 RepID=UPI0003802178|nr:sulfite exporter TauE/SafE family protein [Gracilimonas tropica]